jgi:hypothetical protein
VTDISKWLHHFFGLAFLNPEDVGDSFAVDLIPDMPVDNKVQVFADYVLSTYVDDNAMYPPSVFYLFTVKVKLNSSICTVKLMAGIYNSTCKHTAFC